MAASGGVSLEQLTRRHGIKVVPAERCSVEECSLAVAKVVGHKSVLSAARMNSAIVLFLDDVNKVNEIVTSGIVLNDAYTAVMPLMQPAKKVVLSNVPPFIKDEVIGRELGRHGKIVSQIKKITLKSKSAELKHVVTFRRQVYMILNNGQDLNLVLKFRIDDFDYNIYVTSENMRCFKCGQENHIARDCPGNETNEAAHVVGLDGEIQKENGTQQTQDESLNEEKEGKDSDGSEQGAKSENVTGKEQKIGCEETEARDAVIDSNGELEIIKDVDMMDDDSFFKTPTLKRKTNGKRRGKKARKEQVQEKQMKDVDQGVTSECSNSDDSFSESENESISSVDSVSLRRSERNVYTSAKIKEFLQKTKGMKGVQVEAFFPDRDLFIESARISMKEKGTGSLTEQEGYRLKKMVQKLRTTTLNNEKAVF